MSTSLFTRKQRDTDGTVLRAIALLSTLLVMGSFLTSVYYVVDVVGDPTELVFVTAATLVAATVLSRYLSLRAAFAVSLGMLAVGLTWYLVQLPERTTAFGPHLKYIVALLSGHSILEIVNLKAWVLSVTPGPVFMTWYLALRRRYGGAALVGGATVTFFVLTGDVTFPVAMVGSVGALALVGVGTLERAGARLADAEVVSIVLAVVVLLSLTVTLVPQGAAINYSPNTGFVSTVGGSSANTVEASLLSDENSMKIKGSITLSPEVRWTVDSDSGEYWRVGTFDLYTGDGWVRRAESRADDDALDEPPGQSRQLTQTFTAESDIATMPAAWRPVSIEGEAAENALYTEFGSLDPAAPLSAGDSYSVTSRIPIATSDRLQNAGTDYPEDVRSQFLQLPDSTPDRVYERTARLTANARTPYETALTIESWLEENREYSLDVPAPGNNVADQFLFDREQGYCVYYATTMAVMLRSQGIPARMVVGYTTGERVEDDRWVVRGYNSHAWVEAYFPEVGWVRFDPTPSGPRENIENQSLSEARTDGESNVDTEDTQNPTYTPQIPAGSGPLTIQQPSNPGVVPTPSTNGSNLTTTPTGTTDAATPTTTTDETGGVAAEQGDPFQIPSREHLLLGMVAMVGLVAGVRRSGASSRLYREVWLRWQPRADPETDIERAFDRLSLLLERTNRPRRAGETVRQYLDAIDADERAVEVASIRERAHYSGTMSESEADRAVELVDELVGER